MQTADLRSRFASRAVARLATVRPDGAPHVVPVVFALVDGTVYSAVDAKPKRTRRLQRLANVRADPRCALLVDHYEEDWSELWWVRLDGEAHILRDEPRRTEALAPLAAKYAPYREVLPTGPVIVLTVRSTASWSASA